MNKLHPAALILAGIVLAGAAYGAKIADVRGTKHNLSAVADATATPSGGAVPTRNIKATTETQVCAFCHTPHAATSGVTPLWNRTLSGATYTPYTSSSLDTEALYGVLGQPAGSSKLCLSCHDGTLAIGSVNVLDGLSNPSIAMSGGPNMPAGSGTTTGFTRNLGIDLTNDHPVSVTYTYDVALRDGELHAVSASTQKSADGTTIGPRASGYLPKLPLEGTPGNSSGSAKVQCGTCHDPHLREVDAANGNQKFLRLNRFQTAQPTGTLDTANDIICKGCHEKSGNSWAYSAHANSQVATQTYTAQAAADREFPDNLPVWKAACLNCHDTHTVQGSRRLLREGTDSVSTPKAGGNPAIEETCYQCHSATSTVITPLTTVPDIKSDFALAIRMPITNTDQGGATEAHDIGGNTADAGGADCSTSTNKCGADFVETRAKLGSGALTNRHAECTDCHNPHRVVKFQDFRGSGGSGSLAGAPDSAGTHKHTETTGYTHTNIASGVLRGAYGVEPVYTSNSFHDIPVTFDVKRGDPGTGTDTAASAAYVTREYQICLKCHSNYGYSDNNLPHTLSNLPLLGNMGGNTLAGVNALERYTNTAREIQAPVTHQGLTGSPGDSGAFAGTPPFQAYAVDFQTNNRRGWHPAMNATGRGSANRVISSAPSPGVVGAANNDINSGSSGSPFLPPWNNAIGTQTMYCTDCHGSDTAAGTAIPNGGEDGSPWGPHGSGNNFLLKGNWVALDTSPTATGIGTGTGHPDHICFKCHKYDAYANPAVGGRFATYYSGFSGAGTFGGGPSGYNNYNMHLEHANRMGTIRCSWCHVAILHGWKNKALLVNLNDVGPEATCQTIDIQDGVNCTLGQPMASGTQVRLGGAPEPAPAGGYYWNQAFTPRSYNNPPYYVNAANKIVNFKDSGKWTPGDCGSAGAPGNGLTGMCTGWATSNDGCSVLP